MTIEFRGGQRGVSIVELMVAMLIGSIVILGTVQIFNANRQTFRMQDAMAVTQETGTFALDFIARDMLRAGYPGYPNAAQMFDWTNTSNGAGAGGNDTLAVVYDPSAAGNVFCTGDAVPPNSLASNHYYVSNGQLMCQGGTYNSAATPPFTPVGTAQVLVDNVESFQVTYGVNLVPAYDPATMASGPTTNCPASPGWPTAYVNASLIPAAIASTNNPALNAANVCQETEMQVLRSVRIGLLVKTSGTVDVTVPATQTYTVLDQVIGTPTIQPDDGHLRRLFTKTVMLRNNLENIP